MVPSLPIDLPVNTFLIRVPSPQECGMQRLGQMCGNDAYHVLICPVPSGYDWPIPFCEMCVDDATEYVFQETGKTWLQHLEERIAGNR